ncbi:MAG: lipase/acyltransferase domain-containing protein [Pseudomonadales bacterium]
MPPGPPLIFIPGAFGTTLHDGTIGRERWPSSNLKLLFSRYEDLAMAIDHQGQAASTATLEPRGVLREGLGFDFYGRLLDALTEIGGYQLMAVGTPPPDRRRCLYVYAHDWRRDNPSLAPGLEQLIEQIRIDHQDPRLRVDLLGHSNGGLLAAWFIRYGTARAAIRGATRPLRPGADAVSRLFLLGAPLRGTVQPVLAHLRGEEIGLRRIPPEILATCPGPLQLFPHPDDPWLIDREGRIAAVDLFDVETWRTHRWSIFARETRERVVARHGGGLAGAQYLERLEHYFARQLRTGEAFIRALSNTDNPLGVPVQLFGGDCAPTLARLLLDTRGSHPRVVERAPGGQDNIDYPALMLEPGDTVVTRRSLTGRAHRGTTTLADAPATFLCAEHRSLSGDPVLLDNLLHALLRPPPPQPDAQPINASSPS